jgi:hypothetical protein
MTNKLILLFLSLLSFAKISAMTPQKRLDCSLQWAISQDHPIEEVKALIGEGADVNSRPFNVDLGDYNNLTLLSLAANKNQVETVKTLLEHNAIVDQLDELENTALMHASDSNIITMLLAAGASIDHQNQSKMTALYKAICYSSSKVLTSLLQAITQLTKNEKDSIKNWLLAEQRLGARLPKDLKMLIAKTIYQLFAQDLRECIIRAGGTSPSWIALTSRNYSEDTGTLCVKQIRQYLNLDFLENLVRVQCLLPKQISQ